MADREPLWPKIMGYVLWPISALVGVGVLFAIIDLVETVVPRILRCDPLHMVECAGRARTIIMLAYSAIGIIWLVWYLLLFERYTRAKSPEIVAKRFAITTGIQLAMVLIWLLLTKVVLA